jgi:hypothetical protein
LIARRKDESPGPNQRDPRRVNEISSSHARTLSHSGNGNFSQRAGVAEAPSKQIFIQPTLKISRQRT